MITPFWKSVPPAHYRKALRAAQVTQLILSFISILAVPLPLRGVTYTWVGGYANGWSNRTNWVPMGNPGRYDDVIINSDSGPASGSVRHLTQNAGTTYLNSMGFVTLYGDLTLNGGVLACANTNDCNGISFISTAGHFYWNGGTIVKGCLYVSGAVSLSSTQPKVWYGSNLLAYSSMHVSSEAVLNIVTACTTQSRPARFGQTLDNAGIIICSGTGGLSFWGVITNWPTGLIEIQNPQYITNSSCALYNGGVLRMTNSQGNTTFSSLMHITNTGTIDIQSGTLLLPGNQNCADGTLQFSIYSDTNYSSLRISGNLTTGGSIAVAVPNPASLHTGAQYEVLKFGSRNGYAPQYLGLQLSDGRILIPTLTSTNVVLRLSELDVNVQNSGTGHSLQVNWQADSQTTQEITGYKIYRRGAQSSATNFVDITSAASRGHVVLSGGVRMVIDKGTDLAGGSLLQGTNYEYKVVAQTAQGDIESNPAQAAPVRTVVLVRGYGDTSDNASYWETIKALLQNDGFAVWDAAIIQDCTKSVAWNAQQLQYFIDAQVYSLQSQQRAIPKRLGILAHSMGGLVTRAYLATGPRIPVDTVIMLSPANCGSWSANWVYEHNWKRSALNPGDFRWDSTKDLLVQSAYAFNLAHPLLPVASGRRYYSVAGTGNLYGGALNRQISMCINDRINAYNKASQNFPGVARPINKNDVDFTSDGIITERASWGQEGPAETIKYYGVFGYAARYGDAPDPQFSFQVPCFQQKSTAPDDHLSILNDTSLYRDTIRSLLLGSSVTANTACRLVRSGGATPKDVTPSTNADQLVSVFSANVLEGVTTNWTVLVDPAVSADFQVSSSTGMLNVVLISPDGRRIDTTCTNANSGVSFFGSDSLALYSIVNPTNGIWTVSISAAGLGSAGPADISGSAFVNNDLGFLVDRGNFSCPTKGSIAMLGQLLEGTNGVVNAIISGVVRKPDGSSSPMVLYDDGLHNDGAPNDGLYGATFNDTAQAGTYTIELTATGARADGYPFQRLVADSFTVYEPIAAFAGSFNDYGIDLAPTNGLIDTFVIEVGVTAVAPGTFTVAGTLTTSSGIPITSACTNIQFQAAGTQMVPLAFDACAIYDSHELGGLDLRNLTLIGGPDNIAIMELRTNAFATAGYDYFQFEKLDSDGDGLSDAEEEALGTDPELPDSDFDGMPDGWEVQHGLNPLVDDANLDADGDGMSNLQEYIAGTNPQDPNDSFRLEVSAGQAGTILSIQTFLNRTYGISYTTNLSLPSSWMTLTNGIAGTGARIAITDSNTDVQRFYRATVQLQQ